MDGGCITAITRGVLGIDVPGDYASLAKRVVLLPVTGTFVVLRRILKALENVEYGD